MNLKRIKISRHGYRRINSWFQMEILKKWGIELRQEEVLMVFRMPTIVCKHNLPIGNLDTPFATKVLDRLSKKDYKGVPLPQEELLMCCYPTGCKLFCSRG
jgi:hypothetical protein